jgi:hypothetical protein
MFLDDNVYWDGFVKAKGGGVQMERQDQRAISIPGLDCIQSIVNVEGRLKKHYCVSNNISDAIMLF